MRHLRLAFPVLCLAASPAAAQYWMDKIDRSITAGTSRFVVDVADDGVVVGRYGLHIGSAQSDIAFFYTHADGFTTLGGPAHWMPNCISRDGQVAFGYSTFPAGLTYQFRGQSYIVSSLVITPLACKSDGSEAYGYAQPSTVKVPMVYDRLIEANSAQLPVPSLAGLQTLDVSVTASSSDGKQLAGIGLYFDQSTNSTLVRNVRWNRLQLPVVVSVLPVPSGMSSTSATGISDDGASIVGSALASDGLHKPWVFFPPSGSDHALPLMADDATGDASEISSSGRVIVGNTRSTGGTFDRGRVWRNAEVFSVRSIESLLSARGLDLAHWTQLNIKRISPDGQYLIGDGAYDGVSASWAAYVGLIDCPADITDDGVVDLADFFAFFNCFDATGACADVDKSGEVDLGDFFAFFNAFDAGC